MEKTMKENGKRKELNLVGDGLKVRESKLRKELEILITRMCECNCLEDMERFVADSDFRKYIAGSMEVYLHFLELTAKQTIKNLLGNAIDATETYTMKSPLGLGLVMEYGKEIDRVAEAVGLNGNYMDSVRKELDSLKLNLVGARVR